MFSFALPAVLSRLAVSHFRVVWVGDAETSGSFRKCRKCDSDNKGGDENECNSGLERSDTLLL